jgi:hypothetical protein
MRLAMFELSINDVAIQLLPAMYKATLGVLSVMLVLCTKQLQYSVISQICNCVSHYLYYWNTKHDVDYWNRK